MEEKSIVIIKETYQTLKGFLNEKSRRIWGAAKAESLGGGQTIVHAATGIDYKTIRRGMDEIRNKGEMNYNTCQLRGKVLYFLLNYIDNSFF